MIHSLDKEACIGCGTCQKTCPLDVFRVQPDPGIASPCAAACPAHNDARAWHAALQLGDVDRAAALVWEDNPLAAVTGRVCSHFCEGECSRRSVDGAVNIGGLERWLGDYALRRPAVSTGEAHIFPVAVVGSGPAGLSCAARLAGRGFAVTVCEAREEPGGMLRYGIPEYRLPSAVLAALVDKLRSMGVSFRCGQRMGRDFTPQNLKDEGFGAVFLAPGAGMGRRVAVEGLGGADGRDGFDGETVMLGLDFLRAVRTRTLRAVSGRALVVGGGDVAMDVARTLALLGAEAVTVLSLEADGQLPALAHGIGDARAAGVVFEPSTSVRKVLRGAEGGMEGVEVARCVRVFDENGRFSPLVDESAPRVVSADRIVFAIGQASDLTGVPDEVHNGRTIAADAVTCRTALPWLFAGGDAVTGPASVAAAVGGGKRAAEAIALFLRGGDLGILRAWDKPVAPALAHPDKHRPQKRQEGGRSARATPFLELYGGLDLAGALAEANRCLTCGSSALIAHRDDCMTCFGCELYCPEDAIRVSPVKEAWPRALAPLPRAEGNNG